MHPQRLRRAPDRMSLLGVRVGHLIAWQLIALIVIVALTRRGPAQWPLIGAALVGLGLTVPRWHHRWSYQWLLTAWGFRRAGPLPGGPVGLRAAYRAANPAAGRAAPRKRASPAPGIQQLIDVSAVRVRSGTEAGIVHDGDGFAVIIAIAPKRDVAPVIELPFEALASLLDRQDTLISAVQVVLHSDLAGNDDSGPAAAYRAAGLHRVPRSQSAWITLRHDPAVSGYGPGLAGSARDLHTSLLRSLAGRAVRCLDLLDALGLRGMVLDAAAAGDLLTRALLAPEQVSGAPGDSGGAAATGWRHRWKAWHSAARQHTTYGLARWPSEGLAVLQSALATLPALSVTTAVTVTAPVSGPAELTATVRVTTDPVAPVRKLAAAVRTAASSCGARLVRMDGQHAMGVLATMPLGRVAAPAGGWLASDGAGARGSLTAAVPMSTGGVVLGPGPDAQPVVIPFFTAVGGTRGAVLGDPGVPRLLALRALGAGVRLQVVTGQPGGWLSLSRAARLPPGRMAVVRPGTLPPADGTRADPWLIIDDTGSPAADGSAPWQAVVTVPAEIPDAGALAGLDVILLQRATAARAGAVAGALGLPPSRAEALHRLPDGEIAVAQPGSVQFARLVPDPSEQAMLRESLRPAEPGRPAGPGPQAEPPQPALPG